MKNIFRLLLWVTVVTIPVISGYAQGKGNLSGVVKDDMGETLPGAAIIVKGTTQGTATDLNGAYTLSGIPVGTCEIECNYLGYEPVTKMINITANGTATANFVLKQSAIALGDVVISAAVDGQQRALNQQKVADTLCKCCQPIRWDVSLIWMYPMLFVDLVGLILMAKRFR